MKGPGAHLHRLIRRWTGMGFTANCGCKAMIRKMDDNGPAWCRQHVDEIVDKMRQEAKHRGMWRFLVAIPGTDAPMRWMVLEAIRRSERDGRKD